MNLSLQDPFSVAKEFPEQLTNNLNFGHSVTIQFNYKGDYLASGLIDGSIVIYDCSISNGGIIAHLNEYSHIRPITSINWSKCGRYLLTTSQDWYVKLWDLNKINSMPIIRQIKFDGPIWSANLHPNDKFKFVASLYEDSPVYVDLTNENSPKIIKLSTTPLELENWVMDGEQLKKKSKKNEKHLTLVCIFTKDGKYIFTGTSKGWLNIFETETLKIIHSIKISNSNIKNLALSSNGRKLAINSSDRVIRQINLSDLINEQAINNQDEKFDFEIEHKYQDVVNRLQWNSLTFNHNGEFLIASTHGQSSHDLYIWETSNGSLIKILEGSNEELIDTKWNYPKCCIGSIGIDSGMIYLWQIQFPQKWSALAPDFVEVEENIDYIEKEDEFDIIDETELNKKRLEKEEEDVVDVITKDSTDARGFDLLQESFIIPINYEVNLLV
ncbi:unnamed protein product [Candida verbasci]|uniref:COMPASS component SWD1 n=1 Tax=Candida verbasci TaxID=1227364 RepID=A0A9W4XLN5_9ASCO|nr:unnamed protein product [Candida verbasci]